MKNKENVFSILIICTLMSVFGSSCKAQSQTNVPKNTINSATPDTVTAQGPHRMVRHVRQDKKGDILIASYTAVLKYDGKLFTNITSKISAPSFWDVLEDRKGNLWFATRDSGVYCYNGRSLQHFTTREGLAGNSTFQIFEDKAGNIWFATGGGASRYDGTSFRNFTTKDGLPNNNVAAILEDQTGRLWFGTSGEACFYDGGTFTVIKNKDGEAFNNVRSIIEDKKGNIWFGGSIIKERKGNVIMVENGLWRYDGSTYIKVSQRSASAIMEDQKGNIWTTGAVNPNGVGTWTLSRYDQKSLYDKKPLVTEIMSTQKMLCGMLEAHDGSIWFGAFYGVYRYGGKTITDFKGK